MYRFGLIEIQTPDPLIPGDAFVAKQIPTTMRSSYFDGHYLRGRFQLYDYGTAQVAGWRSLLWQLTN